MEKSIGQEQQQYDETWKRIIPSEGTKRDQRVNIRGVHFCSVPDDTELQLLCTNFLYNSIQKYCTFKRFGDLGMCDYTPEGYANVVAFNAKAQAKRRRNW